LRNIQFGLKKKKLSVIILFEEVNTNKMWYALTEYIWGSTKELPKTRANTMIEEGWIIVNTDDQRQKKATEKSSKEITKAISKQPINLRQKSGREVISEIYDPVRSEKKKQKVEG